MEEKPKVSYRLTVIKTEENTKFAQEMEEFTKLSHAGRMDLDLRSGYAGGRSAEPMRDIPTTALVIELTEKQFQEVKFNVLKSFE